ncbi:winged helix-turn-helix transcriptional regulator [uncultured Enterovirga sp.]|uniref:winged helix-turn-helix transcriptional regulator n=1 Tax=uncultured Enterovirga sp. TaxID=2026352 RepID=UPI0035C9AC4E
MFKDAIRVLTGKWKVELIWTLVNGTLRFGELRRALPGITQHMLTTQLRELESDGLVKRTVYAEIPPRVEYEVTDAALALKPMFRELMAWSQVHGPLARRTGERSS